MNWYVFYNDGYADLNGSVGYGVFPSREMAFAFIENRLKDKRRIDVKCYHVFIGCEVPIKSIEAVTRIVEDRP